MQTWFWLVQWSGDFPNFRIGLVSWLVLLLLLLLVVRFCEGGCKIEPIQRIIDECTKLHQSYVMLYMHTKRRTALTITPLVCLLLALLVSFSFFSTGK